MDGRLTYIPAIHQDFFEALREILVMKWYRRLLVRSFLRYLKVEYGLFWEGELSYARRVHSTNIKERKRKTQARRCSIALRDTSWLNEIKMDILAANDVFTRSIRATFWEWSGRSRLIFWRWTPEYRKEARDGTPIWVRGRYPCYTKRQRRPSDLNQTVALKNKVANVMQKGYIKPDYVKSLTSFFAVPKGQDDIQVVYDATKCLLNDAVWAPSFFLPSVDTILRSVEAATICGDIDLGEMFSNYILDKNLQQYEGVNVTDLAVGPKQ